ncbi:MAG: UvrB/UvrC motif-containing protein [Clostridiales bacterium]|nr:UvrB/UvrC motif-containing protein [Clostridiales bacterium]
MKCEHCGRNEATFFYKSSVNGRVTQVHLCQDCARRMGYTDSLRRSMQPMSLFGDGFFGSAFSLLEPFMDGFGTRMLTEFPEPGEPRQTEEKSGLVDKAQQDALRSERRRNALQEQLKSAVESENYEEAARLRDELRALPGQQ